MIKEQDLAKLPADHPIHSYLLVYTYCLDKGQQIIGNVEYSTHEPIRAFDTMGLRKEIQRQRPSAPADHETIVITNIIPLGVLPNKVYQALAGDSK